MIIGGDGYKNIISYADLMFFYFLEAIESLPKNKFIRVHKSYLVNLNHVQKVEKHQISVTDNVFVPIAANYHSELMEALKSLWKVM